jgi:seryl-tRNA synthetase
MHDIRAIRENPAAFDASLARRGLAPISEQILKMDAWRRSLIAEAENAQANANLRAKEVGRAKERGDTLEFNRLRKDVASSKTIIAGMISAAETTDTELRDLLAGIPNLPLEEVPDGPDESANVEIRRWGTPRAFDFKPLEHFDIPGVKPGMDFATAAKISGSRFVILRGAITRLHRALAQYMLDLHGGNGLTEIWTPVLVKDEAMYGTGNLPKFAEDSYRTTNGWWLVPTSEVTLTNTVAGDIVDVASLPIRMTAHTQCFRSEAGSAGRDTTGMLRQHQFEKVEMVTICTPETALAEHDRMTRSAQSVLEGLGLPYRTVVLCTGDMGFGSQKTHDLEVWLPGQNAYREVSSVSTCGTFQARRMNARYRPMTEDGSGKPEFVATLNGSGLAVGRCMIAVLENGQAADGSVDLPPALHPYLRGATRISATGELE